MTPQEALKVIDKAHDYPCPYGIGGTAWMYIRSCIEKKIPKKPIKKNPICYERTVNGQENYAYDCYCPTCDTNVNGEKHHCPCGQALDWSDTK